MKNLNIALLGHSIATRNTLAPVKGFIDIILEKTQSKLVAQGVVTCSTERLLYQLKSLKQVDMAIIFYGNPYYYFTPKIIKRDFYHIQERIFDEKIETLREIDEVSEQLKEDFLKGTHIDRNEFLAALKIYNKWFFDHKLQQNRHEGSLVLIDQYLLHKKIPVIHSLNKEWGLPSWFEFKSGIIETEFQEFQNNQYRENLAQNSPNNINQEGNNIIAEKLLPLMEAAIQKVVSQKVV